MPISNFNDIYRSSIKKVFLQNFEDLRYPGKIVFGTANLSSVILSKLTNCPFKDGESKPKKVIYIASSNNEYCYVFSNHLSFFVLASRFMRKLGYLLNPDPPILCEPFLYLNIIMPRSHNIKEYETTINNLKDLIILFKRIKLKNIGNNCKKCDDNHYQHFLVYPQLCKAHFDRVPFSILLEFYKNPTEDFNWEVELNSSSSDFLPFLMGLRDFKSDHIVRSSNCIFCGQKISESAWYSPNICIDCSISKFDFNKLKIHYINKIINWKDFFKGKYKFYLNENQTI